MTNPTRRSVYRKDGSTFPVELVGKPFEHKGTSLFASAYSGTLVSSSARWKSSGLPKKKYRRILETIADGYNEVDLAGNMELVKRLALRTDRDTRAKN